MALFFTDFEEYALSVKPSDWTSRWQQNIPFTVEDNLGDKQLCQPVNGFAALNAITWDSVATPGTDFEIITRVFVDNADTARINHGVCFYATAQGGYFVRRTGDNSDFQLKRYNHGTATDTLLAGTFVTNNSGQWAWIKVRVVGSNIKARFWTDGFSEPSVWHIDFTDTDTTHRSGQCGIFGADARSNVAYWSLFGVGTNGDAAPIDGSATSPSLTITPADLPLIPGGTISGTYANYATIPTTLTVSDGTNTITIPNPGIVDDAAGGGTFSTTMPSLPTTGTANLVLFTNSATVELI